MFVRDGTGWSQQAYLKAYNAGVNDGFGACVAVSGDTVGVVWEDNRSGSPQCYLAMKPEAAATFQPEIRLSQSDCYEPVVIALGKGRFVAAWEEAGKVHARVLPGGAATRLTDAESVQVTLALRNVGRTEVLNAPLVFGGYGVVDAARGWDAYAGVDLRGGVDAAFAAKEAHADARKRSRRRHAGEVQLPHHRIPHRAHAHRHPARPAQVGAVESRQDEIPDAKHHH